MEGYEWPFGNGELCLTVFSASNYAGRSTNRGEAATCSNPRTSAPCKLRSDVSPPGVTLLSGGVAIIGGKGATKVPFDDGLMTDTLTSYTFGFGEVASLAHRSAI